MKLSRRRTLRLASAAMGGTILAGCLSEADPATGDDGANGDDDPDDASIDGRLHNHAAEMHVFEVTIRDEDDTVVAEDEWEVEADSTTTLPAFGRPGEPRTFEVAVAGATATETLAFDVESTPGRRAGYVDVTYTEEGTVDIAFTPVDGNEEGELARVDVPLYEIDEPECTGTGDRDPLWLCENMAAEPSLGFDQVATSGTVLREEGLRLDREEPGAQFYATLLSEEADLDRVAREEGGAPVELIEETDFDSEAVLVAQTGWGSGSITPHLKRIEETGEGIHAFGCYRRPCGGTTDHTMRTVVARFERPDGLESGRVSLTVDPETRVNVEVGEGVVTVEGVD